MNAVVQIEPRRSLMMTVSERFAMEPKAFEATVRANCLPQNATTEQLAAFLIVVNEYGLNPILREIYAMPGRGGAIQTIVGVDGWLTLINRQPNLDGITFEDRHDDRNQLQSITCRIYRKDRQHPTEATEYLAECRRSTDTWKQWPHRMLRHKALIQAARIAFGFAGVMEPDEYERMSDGQRAIRAASPPTVPPSPPAAASRPPSPPPAPEPVVSMATEPAGDDPPPFVEADYLDKLEVELKSATTLDALNEVWAHNEITLEDSVSPAGQAKAKSVFAERSAKLYRK